jgi:hypothetical protein
MKARLIEDLAIYGVSCVDDRGRRVPPDELVFRHETQTWFRRTPSGLVPMKVVERFVEGPGGVVPVATGRLYS